MSTPKEQWQITDAFVYSLDLIQPSRDEPRYDVVYSYKVGEERYTGRFSDYYRGDGHPPLRVNDTISIRYCPEHPSKSYYPDAQQSIVSRWFLLAVMLLTALVTFLFAYFSNGHHAH